jgi:acetylornithine/N-succinyldiaminopimelate aminotransferase
LTNENQLQQERWKASLQNNYGTPEISLVKGLGAQVWDADGNEYLDFLGGIATNILGHAHPALIAAVTKQVNELGHVSNLYSHPRTIELAEKLKGLTGYGGSKSILLQFGSRSQRGGS